MKKFLIKMLTVFSPIWILSLAYIVLDPFMVIHSYDNYHIENQKRFDNKAGLTLNYDFVGTVTLLKNTVKPNSYIFGSSRSRFYDVADWKRYLPPGAACFHFDGSGEPVWTVQKKVDFLDKHGYRIDNALFVLDHHLLSTDRPGDGHLFIISPQLVNNDNLVKFHGSFFRAFCNPAFLYAYFDLLFSKTYKPYMKKLGFVNILVTTSDTQTNEVRWEIDGLGDDYYTGDVKAMFYERGSEQTYYPPAIKKSQTEILKNIRAVFDRHETNYKIIVNPLYDQKKLDGRDLNELRNIFGERNIYDFSGINDFTGDFHNYYEPSHYRPRVAREILRQIYR